VAALYNGSGYQSVFFFIAGTWLVGAVVLAVFGPRTRPAKAAGAENDAKSSGSPGQLMH
jgi:putative MFS transporter